MVKSPAVWLGTFVLAKISNCEEGSVLLLEETIKKIGELDRQAQKRTRLRLDDLTKPPGSLGMLEEVVVKIAGITGKWMPSLEKKAVIVMAGDHGVVAEGVSAFPQEVTPQMVRNFLRGGAAINVLSRHAGAEVVCVDIGVAAPLKEPGLLSRKIAPGTRNIAEGPAMTLEEARKAIEVGIEVATQEIAAGVQLLATGDMGIGNTTPSTAILAAFTGFPVSLIAGKGTGLDDRGLQHKVEVIERALRVNKPDPRDGLDVLSKVGGFEIGGLAGVILGAAASRVPVVIDGFISGAAAMIARALAPRVVDYIIASHLSEEPGHKIMLKWLGLEPMIQMRMRLGEGTGAVLAFHLIEAGLRILREMATFSEAQVSKKSED
ncbi:MAG: Nicotinate-nucleotide--dimethylbenzimidazole phosphoribosyltransferase [Thermoanaerobacterales bacterium 50_218]|nr:MAG: Nicotinate-nucleotide--dimethylbenzimidazole phosphoribosyltransferase [Thermoanaerobacterales bacterium 50_218]HAA89441.1 nicotinate-nucleotide--dimethylbenzimidazole phosphoribosyltransferase [Peptococcaceae bacterium]